MVFFSAMKRIRRVAIVLRMSGSAGRDILSGVFHFTRMHPNWHTRLFQMPSEFTPDAFLAESAVGLDGIIASEPGPDETAALVRDSKIPLSFIGDPGPVLSTRRNGIAFTRNDDDQIGRIGARYLVSLGAHRAYGFVPTTSRQYWSDSRERGFTEELKLRKAEPVVFRSPGAAGSREDLAALKEWLVALPKPAAVMTAWDTRATQVLNLCQEARIKVPRHISVLGVDNDELLDESCVPPLTSILPDHEKLGYAAARALERLMAERVPKDTKPFLIRTSAIRNLIREQKVEQISTAIQTGGSKGMITMNQSLIDLYRRQRITYQEAVNRSPDPEDLKKLMQKTLSVMG